MTYNITELEGNEPAPLRKQYALDPLTHPDVLEIIAKYDIDPTVANSILKNPSASENIKDIVKKRFGHIDEFNKNACPLLWNHVSTFANGDVRMCCEMIGEDADYGKVYDDKGQTINVHDHRLLDVRNNHKSKLLRKIMLAGGKPRECQQCYHREELGMDSKRTGAVTRYNKEISNFISNTMDDGSILTEKIPLRDLDLRFGNTCNLKCRSCGPQDSNLWYEDYYKLNENQDNKELNLWFYGENKYKLTKSERGVDINTDRFVWKDQSLFYNDLLEVLSDIRTIYFTGGEPTVIKKHKQLLEYCIEKDYAKDIILDYNTNLHATPTYLSDYWKKFKLVNIGASIDGYGETQGYMRPPSTWEGIQKNIVRLNDLQSNNINVRITPTYSIMNMANITKLADWLISQNFEYIYNVLGNHTLYYPEIYSVQILPQEAKIKLKLQYDTWLDDLKNKDINLFNKYKACFEPVLNFMLEKDESHLMEAFIEKTQQLDNIRNEDWKIGLPDLYKLLKEVGYV